MLLAAKVLEDSEKCSVAAAVYAIARTVQTMRTHELNEPERFMHFFWRDGYREQR